MIAEKNTFAQAAEEDRATLNQMASASFSFRDLIECGATWHRLARDNTPIDNVPLQPGSWFSLSQLATCLLDPLQDRFGKIQLTYGFCSRSLQRHIQAGPRPGISPSNDQHAACELNSRGKPICRNPGAACDLHVVGMEDQMDEVAHWIIDNLAFDALYYYGCTRPLHLSWGPEMRKMTVLMRTTPETGVRVPAGNRRGGKGHTLIEACGF